MLSLGNNSSEESPDTIPDLLQLVISSPVNAPSTTCVLTYSTPVFLRSFSLLPHISSSTKPLPSSANPASAEIISEVAELFLELQSKRLKDINGIGGSGTRTSFFCCANGSASALPGNFFTSQKLQMLGGRRRVGRGRCSQLQA